MDLNPVLEDLDPPSPSTGHRCACTQLPRRSATPGLNQQFPAATREQAGSEDGTAAPGKEGRRILVVDDDPVFADLVGSMLALGAHQVQTAKDGKQALDLLECGKFDLVMTDYNMPGMDGDELATAIKALNPAQPIALVTGEAEFLQSRGARLESVDVIINKPFTLEELRQAVAKLLASLDAGGLRQLKNDDLVRGPSTRRA